MDDSRSLIDALGAHQTALVTEIEELQAHIADDTRRLSELQMKLESVLELMRMEGALPVEGGLSGRHFVEEAYDIVLQGGPLHYTAVAAQLRDRRVFVPGVRPEMNLLTHINRDRRFERVGRGIYRVRVDHAGAGSQQPTRRKPKRRRAA